MIVVLMVASGSPWETPALRLLGDQPGIAVLKRCVDVDDLLAAASSGQADVAVVGLDAPGLDVRAVDRLHAHGMRAVAVAPAGSMEGARVRASRIGIAELVSEDRLDALPTTVNAAQSSQVEVDDGGLGPPPMDPPASHVAERGASAPAVPAPGEPGRMIAVWGPAGAPGRTTLATALAADLARRGRRVILVDADPYGGSVAQQLGILDEVSGLLSAGRLATAGQLEERIATVQRGLDSRLSVITGLPRADRWIELRTGTIEHLLEVARQYGDVVVDTGFCLEDDPTADYGTRPTRNQLTLGSLGVADEIVVVGAADPVGLSRLARGLVDLREQVTRMPVRVVINRMRPSLGWSEKDIAGMVAGFARLSGLHFLPDDRAGVDKALVTGRLLGEVAESAPLSKAITQLCSMLLDAPRPDRQLGRGRGRHTDQAENSR